MSPEAQRIAIAEACGWKSFDDPFYQDGRAWLKGQHRFATCDIPDYQNDLNAMYDAEQTIVNQDEFENYATLLINSQIDGDGSMEPNITTLFDAYGWFGLLKATAAQRAEAFLKAKGLWKE